MAASPTPPGTIGQNAAAPAGKNRKDGLGTSMDHKVEAGVCVCVLTPVPKVCA